MRKNRNRLAKAVDSVTPDTDQSAVKNPQAAIQKAAQSARGPSPNAMTNLIITDIALRGGGRLIRHVLERNLLGVKYPQSTAKELVSGRSMANTLLGTAIARVATRSVPGALIVGGSLLAKTLYDRRKGKDAREAGKAAIEKRVDRANRQTKI